MKVTPDIAKQAVNDFYPKSAMQLGEIRDLERSLNDALEYKFMPAAEDAEGHRGPDRHRLQAVAAVATESSLKAGGALPPPSIGR